jgi:hypothetical protein
MRLLQQPSSAMETRQMEFLCHFVAISWLSVFSVGLQPAVAREPQFEVRGFMQQIDRTGKTNLFCDFWVAVSGRRSLIKVVYFNGESFACGTDGIDSYLLNEMVPTTRQKGAGTTQFADISAGPFPRLALSPVQMAWLAFASGGSLHKGGNKLPMECFREIAPFTSSQVVLSTSPPHLPRSVKWWGPNFYVVGTTKEHQPLLAYPEGYLAGTYTIGATTNFGGYELPLQWKLAFYLPNFQKQSPVARRDDVVPCGALAATVTNVSSLVYSGDYLPSIGAQPVQITEHRLEKETGRGQQYPVINGVALTHWPRRDDPYFIMLARNSSPVWRLWWSVTGRNYRRGLIIVGAVGLLAAALYLMFWSSKGTTS